MINKKFVSLFGNHENEMTSIAEWIIFDDIVTILSMIYESFFVRRKVGSTTNLQAILQNIFLR